jgi:enoyl-CoA hydratase
MTGARNRARATTTGAVSQRAARSGARSSVALHFDGAVAEVGLNGGPLNLVNKQMLHDFNHVLGEIVQRRDIRCLILHGGSARAFCAGSDIKELHDLRQDASEQKILFEDMVLRRLARVLVPTIAAIDGPALGGGLEIALACDLRVCRAGIELGLPECRLGGLAGNGSIRLTRLIGPARAKELLYTGETIVAEQALEWGLVNRVVADGTALKAARQLASTIAARGPLSNRLAKKLVDAAQDCELDAGLSLSTVAQQEIFDSHDLREGAAAFLGKRRPVFTGQ